MAETIRVDLTTKDPYAKPVPEVLARLDLESVLAAQRRIVIKPNLVTTAVPPVTTDVRCVEALVKFCLACSGAEVVVAEGSGGADTGDCYNALGYNNMAHRLGIRLVDLDQEPLVTREEHRAVIYRSFKLPRILNGSFIISVPVLKEHTITDVSLSLKNMIGICPASEFSGFLSYKKSRVHRDNVDQAIVDINLHCPVDLAVIDGVLGMRGSHLGGPVLEPPAGVIIAGRDPVAVDAQGARKLGHDWRRIEHLQLAHGLLGRAE